MSLANVALIVALLGSVAGCSGCGSQRASGRDGGGARSPQRIETLRGVHLGDLTRDERRVLLDVVNEELDPCGSARSLAVALERGDCRRAPFAARFVVKLVELDLSAEEIGDLYVRRYGAQAVRRIEIGASPATGGEMAPVTLVEFADYECPHCAESVSVIDELVRRYDGKVRLVFKNFPLERHEYAEAAARAALAAHRQGKFWEMHHLLFRHQDALARPDLLRYAEQLGLDMERFGRDFEGTEVAEAVRRDRAAGDALGIEGTPTFFVNGRMLEGGFEDLPSFIDEELEARQ